MRTHQGVRHLGRFAIFYKRFFDQFSPSIASNTAKPEVTEISEKKETQKLEKVMNNVQELLLDVNSIFPFMLFPDSLLVDRQKVMLIHRSFFGVSQRINIQVGDLQAIEVDLGPFFGTVSITTKQFSNTVNKIHMLTREDAIQAQRLLQGFVVANKQKLDYSNIEKNKLVAILKKLGQGGS
jgi:hypothetical protein